jgi:hypothetical protein
LLFREKNTDPKSVIGQLLEQLPFCPVVIKMLGGEYVPPHPAVVQ